MQNTNILDFTIPELESFMHRIKEKSFRAKQIHNWLWQRSVFSYDFMTNLSLPLRKTLSSQTLIGIPEVVTSLQSTDGTVKFLLRLFDGNLIETVLIPEKDHFTMCISTQVGCAMGCSFCSTGDMGFIRNLSSGEILVQVLLGRRYLLEQSTSYSLRNLVFMGMGEPLLNLKELKKCLMVLTDPAGPGYSPRRITVSTVGFPEQLKALGDLGLSALAVSLHAPNQELRERIMPHAAKIHLDELMRALQSYPLKPRQRITMEYILLGGVNDTLQHGKQLVALLSHVKSKVNLIAYNPPKESLTKPRYRAPEPSSVDAFLNFLISKNITATLRKSKGPDISAACGQLFTEHARLNS